MRIEKCCRLIFRDFYWADLRNAKCVKPANSYVGGFWYLLDGKCAFDRKIKSIPTADKSICVSSWFHWSHVWIVLEYNEILLPAKNFSDITDSSSSQLYFTCRWRKNDIDIETKFSISFLGYSCFADAFWIEFLMVLLYRHTNNNWHLYRQGRMQYHRIKS